VIEPEIDGRADQSIADAHDMVLEHVFAQVRTLGGKLGRVIIVGCEVEDASERIGLRPSVESAVDEAVRVILELVGQSREAEVRREA
ncbi:MAG TPA: peptidase M52, partial [Candidatus Dormibacteraeota bacterium]|nr:peptidase M52 [Candidatus Dormibacteraeota bacterium]